MGLFPFTALHSYEKKQPPDLVTAFCFCIRTGLFIAVVDIGI